MHIHTNSTRMDHCYYIKFVAHDNTFSIANFSTEQYIYINSFVCFISFIYLSGASKSFHSVLSQSNDINCGYQQLSSQFRFFCVCLLLDQKSLKEILIGKCQYQEGGVQRYHKCLRVINKWICWHLNNFLSHLLHNQIKYEISYVQKVYFFPTLVSFQPVKYPLQVEQSMRASMNIV